MQRAALLVAGCQKGIEDGFAVALHMHFDATVSESALGSVRTLEVVGGVDDSYSTLLALPTPARDEFLLYRPLSTTRNLTLAVTAFDANNDEIAFGITPTLKLPAGKTTSVELELSATTGTGDAHIADGAVDFGADGDETDGGGAALALELNSVPTYSTSAARSARRS